VQGAGAAELLKAHTAIFLTSATGCDSDGIFFVSTRLCAEEGSTKDAGGLTSPHNGAIS